MDDKHPAEWGIMTDRERAAWEKSHEATEKSDDKPKSRTAEDIIADMQGGERGSYLRKNQHTDHTN